MSWIKRALGVCLIVVLASTLTILTTGVIVNAYVQSALASFNIKLDQPAPGLVGMLRTLMGTKDKPAAAGVVKGSQNPSDQDKTKTEQGKSKSGTSDTPSKSSEQPAEEKVPEDSIAVMGQAGSEDANSQSQGGGALDQEVVMTPEAMRDLKDNLPSAEKVNIFNILMNKLPPEEMQKISAAMEDGLTEAEVKEMQEVIAKYVEPSEYEALMKMLTPSAADSSPQ